MWCKRKLPTRGVNVLCSSSCPPVSSCGILNASTILWHYLFKWRAVTPFFLPLSHIYAPNFLVKTPLSLIVALHLDDFSSSPPEEWNLWMTINQFTGLIALGRMIGVKATSWVHWCHGAMSRLVLISTNVECRIIDCLCCWPTTCTQEDKLCFFLLCVGASFHPKDDTVHRLIIIQRTRT